MSVPLGQILQPNTRNTAQGGLLGSLGDFQNQRLGNERAAFEFEQLLNATQGEQARNASVAQLVREGQTAPVSDLLTTLAGQQGSDGGFLHDQTVGAGAFDFLTKAHAREDQSLFEDAQAQRRLPFEVDRADQLGTMANLLSFERLSGEQPVRDASAANLANLNAGNAQDLANLNARNAQDLARVQSEARFDTTNRLDEARAKRTQEESARLVKGVNSLLNSGIPPEQLGNFNPTTLQFSIGLRNQGILEQVAAIAADRKALRDKDGDLPEDSQALDRHMTKRLLELRELLITPKSSGPQRPPLVNPEQHQSAIEKAKQSRFTTPSNFDFARALGQPASPFL